MRVEGDEEELDRLGGAAGAAALAALAAAQEGAKAAGWAAARRVAARRGLVERASIWGANEGGVGQVRPLGGGRANTEEAE